MTNYLSSAKSRLFFPPSEEKVSETWWGLESVEFNMETKKLHFYTLEKYINLKSMVIGKVMIIVQKLLKVRNK